MNPMTYRKPWYPQEYIYCDDTLPCGWITIAIFDKEFYIFNVKGCYDIEDYLKLPDNIVTQRNSKK